MTYYTLKSKPNFAGMLKLQFKDQRRKPFWVMEDTFSIGSGRDNNLVLTDAGIKNVHVRFISQGDSFVIKTADNDALLEVNGVATEQINVSCGDLIQIGEVKLQVVDPLDNTVNSAAPYWSLIADSSWLSGQEFPLHTLPGTSITVGRGSQCDIVFAGTHLSRQHAELHVGVDSLTIRDLNSANGTFVNGKRVQEAVLKAGDRLRLDVYSFRIFGPGIKLPAASTTARFKAITDKDLDKALSKSRKSWKTRSTSPGNRIEPESRPGKTFTWVTGVLIVCLFAAALLMVLGI